jgi:phosphatidylglycerophosphatase A
MSASVDHETSVVAGPIASPSKAERKPRFALFIATAGGLGYLPKAPGTWGSLGGLLVALAPWWAFWGISKALAATQWGQGIFLSDIYHRYLVTDPFLAAHIALVAVIGAMGVQSAGNAAKFWNTKDPQRVVIDEVSGQHITLLLGCAAPVWWRHADFAWTSTPLGLITTRTVLNWKYLLLGFILFRVFDIWKPFPARQAESLPGGWGIMADDWAAAVYAGIGLWIARAAGLS